MRFRDSQLNEKPCSSKHDVGRKCLVFYLGLNNQAFVHDKKMVNENLSIKPNMGNQLKAKLRKVVKQPSMLFRHEAEER